MIRRLLARLRLSPADALVILGFTSILLALGLPTVLARGHVDRVAALVGDVEAMRDAAASHRASTGSWPRQTDLGEIPPEMSVAFFGDTTLVREGYTLQWTTWEVVDLVEAPPDEEELDPADGISPETAPNLIPTVGRIGGVVVHSADATVLAELLSHFGPDVSFARDGVWTLVLPERVAAR